MNDCVGRATTILDGYGVGELPPVVPRPLIREGRPVEITPEWHMRKLHLALAHLATRHLPRVVRTFKEFAPKIAPTIFPDLPV